MTVIMFEKKFPPKFTFILSDHFSMNQNVVLLSGDHDKYRK